MAVRGEKVRMNDSDDVTGKDEETEVPEEGIDPRSGSTSVRLEPNEAALCRDYGVRRDELLKQIGAKVVGVLEHCHQFSQVRNNENQFFLSLAEKYGIGVPSVMSVGADGVLRSTPRDETDLRRSPVPPVPPTPSTSSSRGEEE